MCIRSFFRAGSVERGTGEASGKSSGTESRMGEERKKIREEKLTVKVCVEECKEDSYKRETNGIGRVDEEI